MTEATKKPQPARPFKQEALLAVMQGIAVHFAHDKEGALQALEVGKTLAERMTTITRQWAKENDARDAAKGAQE